jgi:probable phosphoglycerate mutase
MVRHALTVVSIAALSALLGCSTVAPDKASAVVTPTPVETGIAPDCAQASKGPTVATPATDAPRRRIYLLRHGDVNYFDANGKPVANPDEVFLTPKGHAEARAAGEWFCRMGVRGFDRVITSNLPRTQQTAADLLDAMGLLSARAEAWPDLREVQAGSKQQLSTMAPDELKRTVAAFMQPRVAADARLFGGESVAEARARILPAIERLRGEQWDTVLIVAHTLTNQVILTEALTGSPEVYTRLEQTTGCINILDVGDQPGDWVVRAIDVCPESSRYWTRESLMDRLKRQAR